MKSPLYLTAMFLATICPSTLVALEEIPAGEARQVAEKLVKLASKTDNPQVKIEADVSNANGVHVRGKLGIMVVPQKDLRESEELAAKFKEDAGAALGYLFAYRVLPVVNGKPVDDKQLRSVKFTADGGVEHTVYVHRLAVRQLADDDYRLYVYGAGKKPIVDAKFSQGEGPGPVPVAVHVKDTDEQTMQGTAVVTVFGKYQASFRVAHPQ